MPITDLDNQVASSVGELIQWHQRKSQHFCDTYIFEPENEQEAQFGKLLILIKVDENSKKAQEIADGLSAVMQHNFYNSPETEFVANFENALAKTNAVLAELAAAGEVRWMGKLSAVICAHKEHQLVVARTGHTKAFLIRDGEPVEIGESTTPSENAKTFSAIAQGEVMPKDYIVLSTGKLLNSISLTQIAVALKENPVLTAIRQLEPLIDQDPATPTCALFMKIDTARAIAIENQKDEQLAELSPEELHRGKGKRQLQNWYDDFRSRRWTMKIAAIFSLLWIYISKAGMAIKTFSVSLFKNMRGRISSQRALNKEAKDFIKSKEDAPKDDEAISAFTKTEPLPPVDDEVMVIKDHEVENLVGPKKKKMGHTVNMFGANIKKSAKRLPGVITQMPTKSKILLGSAVALIVVFGVSLAVFGSKKTTQDKSGEYSAMLTQAEQKNNEAAAALIYNDTDKARSLFAEAKGLTAQVLGSSFYNAEAAALQKKIDDSIFRIDHANEVQDASVVVNFADHDANARMTGLVFNSGKLYSLDTAGKKLSQVDIASAAIQDTALTTAGNGTLSKLIPLVDGNAALVATDQSEVSLFDFTKNTLTTQKIELPDPNLAAGASYAAKNLYLLFPNNSAIYKYTKGTTSGFTKGSKWNKTGTLNSAVDLAVDGAVYVLNADGTITQFVKGTPSKVVYATPKTPLSAPTQIITSEHFKDILVVDPANKRIVEYAKDGAVVHEYTSEQLTDLHSVALDESSKVVYCLAGQRILKFALIP